MDKKSFFSQGNVIRGDTKNAGSTEVEKKNF